MDAEKRVRFGRYLQALRSAKGLSLRQASAKIGQKVTASYLSQVENGLKPPPSKEVLLALADAYDVSPTEVFHQAGLEADTPHQVYSLDDVKRAFQFVKNDPRFQFGTYVADEEMSMETMLFIVELYQKARGLKLLTRPEEEGTR